MADQPAPTELHVVSPDGTLGTIPHEYLGTALQQGYRPATADELTKARLSSEYDAPVTTGAESAARALTFGGSDLLMAGTGLKSQRDLSLEKQYNPTASTVGEVAGTAAGLLTGAGAPGAIAKAGALAEGAVGAGTGLLGKAAVKGLSGAVEGGLFGVGNAFSESAIGDSELTAEKLLASGGAGALLGGAGGAALEVGGAGLSKAVKAAKGSLDGAGLQSALQDFAEKRAVVAGGAMANDLKGLQYRGQLNARGRFMLDNGIMTPGATLDTVAERAGAKRVATGQRLGELADQFDQAAWDNEHVDGKAVADIIRGKLVGPLEAGNSADQALAKRIAAEADVAEAKGTMTFKEADEYKRSFDKHLKFNAEQGPFQEQIKQVRGIVKDATEEAASNVAQRIGPETFDEWKGLKSDYGHLKEIEQTASKRMAAKEANRLASPSDYGATGMGLLGAASHGVSGPLSIATGLATGAANKALRTYGDSVMASGADALANSKLFGKIAGAFSKDLTAKLESMPEAFGPFRGVLTQAAAKGADDLLAAHIQLAQKDPAYGEVMQRVGFGPEQDANGVAKQFGHLEAVHAATDAFDSRADAAMGRFLGRQGGAAPLFDGPSASRDQRQADFQARMDKLDSIVNNSQTAASAMTTGDLGNYAPATAAALTANATKAAAFLQSKAPKNPDSEVIPALQTPWAPNVDDLGRWERYVRAVDNPMSVLADLKNGVVTPESVEAMRTVYPKMLSEMQEKMMTRLQGYNGKLSPTQKNAIQTLFGAQSQSTANVFQDLHQQAAAQKAAQDQQAAQNAMGGGRLDVSSMATPAQKMEAK